MGYEITLVLDEGDKPYRTGFPFTSAHQSVLIGEWAMTLDKKKFKSVRDLFIDGYTEDSTDLMAELEVAMKFHPIKDAGSREVIRNFQKEIGIGVPGEKVYITE